VNTRDVIPAGNYEVVVAHAEDAQTRSEHYMRRMTLVVIGQAIGVSCPASVSRAEYIGGVLHAFAVDHPPAEFVWHNAVEHPGDFDIGQRFNAKVVQETTERWGTVNRIERMSVRPGDDMPPRRHAEPEEPGCEHCNGGVGEDPHSSDCPTVRGPAREIRAQSASRRSAVERERDRIEATVAEFLYETADCAPRTEPEPYAYRTGQIHGVALPDTDLQAGAIVSAEYARKLGAQLILAADQHDNLLEAGR
jgi:hypothetical protein